VQQSPEAKENASSSSKGSKRNASDALLLILRNGRCAVLEIVNFLRVKISLERLLSFT
jgi:hypothetical protein